MKLTIAAIQFNPQSGKIQHNLKEIERLVENAVKAGTELIVLPEICDIGYDLRFIKKLAEAFPNSSSKRISGLASKFKVIIIAGLAEKRVGKIFNTAVAFDNNGNISAKYRKVHLCTIPPINELSVFTAGEDISVSEIAGVKIGFSICYDIRFPELYRKLAVGGAQIVVMPTAFPKSRIEQLEICMRARAIENQFFIVSANHCGKSGDIELGGRSMIVGPEGQILAVADVDTEEVITAQIELDDISKVRKEKPVFTGRRPEVY